LCDRVRCAALGWPCNAVLGGAPAAQLPMLTSAAELAYAQPQQHPPGLQRGAHRWRKGEAIPHVAAHPVRTGAHAVLPILVQVALQLQGASRGGSHRQGSRAGQECRFRLSSFLDWASGGGGHALNRSRQVSRVCQPAGWGSCGAYHHHNLGVCIQRQPAAARLEPAGEGGGGDYAVRHLLWQAQVQAVGAIVKAALQQWAVGGSGQ
jgi:hypothetical protein